MGNDFLGIKFGIGWRGDIARDAKQRAEGVAGVESAVETKCEFIEIRFAGVAD